MDEQLLNDLWSLVAAIPPGKVVSYGSLGRAMQTPSSGYMVGRWMARAPEGLPWWRVVGKNGELRTAGRDPRLADLQKQHLEADGIKLLDGKVDMETQEHSF